MSLLLLSSIVLTDDTRHWQLGHYVTLAGERRMHGTGNRSFCGQSILTHWQRQDLLPQIILVCNQFGLKVKNIGL
jgi:hypothetical protein